MYAFIEPDPWSSDSDLSDLSPIEDEYAKVDKSDRRSAREPPDLGDVTAVTSPTPAPAPVPAPTSIPAPAPAQPASAHAEPALSVDSEDNVSTGASAIYATIAPVTVSAVVAPAVSTPNSTA